MKRTKITNIGKEGEGLVDLWNRSWLEQCLAVDDVATDSYLFRVDLLLRNSCFCLFFMLRADVIGVAHIRTPHSTADKNVSSVGQFFWCGVNNNNLVNLFTHSLFSKSRKIEFYL